MSKMTDEEIIKALECCSKDDAMLCYFCPFLKNCSRGFISRNALVLINRQQAEIERLKNSGIRANSVEDWLDYCNGLKADAIKEFAERLKATPMRFSVEYVKYYDKPPIKKMVLFIDDNDINNLVKEMVGEGK